jgi:hypothetical protein
MRLASTSIRAFLILAICVCSYLAVCSLWSVSPCRFLSLKKYAALSIFLVKKKVFWFSLFAAIFVLNDKNLFVLQLLAYDDTSVTCIRVLQVFSYGFFALLPLLTSVVVIQIQCKLSLCSFFCYMPASLLRQAYLCSVACWIVWWLIRFALASRCFGKKKVEPEVKGDGAPAPAAVAAEEGAKPAAAPMAGGESHWSGGVVLNSFVLDQSIWETWELWRCIDCLLSRSFCVLSFLLSGGSERFLHCCKTC